MASTELEIDNLALGRIGASRITQAQLTAGSTITPGTTDTTLSAQLCYLNYSQTRDALLRSHRWRFAGARIKLASAWADDTAYTTDMYVLYSETWYKCAEAHTSDEDGGDGTGGYPDSNSTQWTEYTTYEPAFEWDYQFDLPSAWLARRETYENNNTRNDNTVYSYKIEGSKYLTNDATVLLRYTKKVTDVTDFDPLFIEVLVLQLALKLVMPITKDLKMYESIKDELYGTPRRPGLMSKVRAMDLQEQNTRGRNDMNTWNDARYSGRIPSKMGS